MTNPPDDTPGSKPDLDQFSPIFFPLAAIGAGVGLIILCVSLAMGAGLGVLKSLGVVEGFSTSGILQQGVGIIAIAVVAILSLLIVVVAMSRLLALLNLQNHPHALGLPAGSVRAIFAISFIVLLAVLSVFTVQNAKPQWVQFGAIETARKAVSDTEDPKIVSQAKSQARGDLEEALSAKAPEDESWRVSVLRTEVAVAAANGSGGEVLVQGVLMVREEPGRAVEIAKDVLTIVATALTAIVGFYFGSRSQRDGAQTAAGGESGTEGNLLQAKGKLQDARDALDALRRAKIEGKSETDYPGDPEGWKALSGSGEGSVKFVLASAEKILADISARQLEVAVDANRNAAAIALILDATKETKAVFARLDELK